MFPPRIHVHVSVYGGSRNDLAHFHRIVRLSLAVVFGAQYTGTGPDDPRHEGGVGLRRRLGLVEFGATQMRPWTDTVHS